MMDMCILGINVLVRESGKIEGIFGVMLMNGLVVVILSYGLIVVKCYIYMIFEDVLKNKVSNS